MKAQPLVLLIKSSVELMSFVYLFIGLLDTLQIWELQIPKVFLEKSKNKKYQKNLIIGLNFA
jgi:hypothetical protein